MADVIFEDDGASEEDFDCLAAGAATFDGALRLAMAVRCW
jgi:hypothetical protein